MCDEFWLCKFIRAGDKKNWSRRRYIIPYLRSPNWDIEDLTSYPVPRASDEYTCKSSVAVEQNEYLSLFSVVYSSRWNLFLTWHRVKRPKGILGYPREGVTWDFGERRESRPQWAGQPGQKKELVDDDQYPEEWKKSGYLSVSLVTHFPAL